MSGELWLVFFPFLFKFSFHGCRDEEAKHERKTNIYCVLDTLLDALHTINDLILTNNL
jgi:hypothetical protein